MKDIQLFNEQWSISIFERYRYYVRGWAEINDEILNAEKLIQFIHKEHIDTKKGFEELGQLLNGSFSIIIASLDRTYLISDRMRAFPIIYFIQNDSIIVTDDIMEYQKKNSIKLPIDELTCEQFLCSNYIIGPYTIFKDVFSTQSGEVVTIDHTTQTIDRKQYFQWAPNMAKDTHKRDYELEAKKQDEVFTSVFNRMIKSAPNVNNWIIPLSGGYDSRAIVNYLFKLGVKNVICFTYGMESNIQSEISQKVAESLGYEWHFIDYTEWIDKMKEKNILDDYLEFGFNGSSVAHLQDFPAVYALKEMGVLDNNDVFVPGHALEVIAGNHLKHSMQTCKSVESVIPVIFNHFSGFGYHSMKRRAIFKHVQSVINNYNLKPVQMAECFDWQERQTKFIANSVKVYEYFGYSSRIPEWDIELMNYWDKIGFNYKYDRSMFKDVFKNYLTIKELKSIPFANDLIVKQKQNFKSKLINSVPFWIKKILRKSGVTTSFYYLNEGSHLIYADNKETIADYLSSFNAPLVVRKYLKPYASSQQISKFEINSVSTLLNIRRSIVN